MLFRSMSFWCKRGETGREHAIYGATNGGGETFFVAFYPDDIEAYISTGRNHVTNAVFRDPSAWYHIVQVFDSANATADDRFITYVNGVRQTTSTNSVTQNDTTGWNTSGVTGYFGKNYGAWFGDSRDHFDGYLAEANFIDGQALDPTYFGETKNGIWIAKEYTGTYGNNGFYFDFSDSSALGDDKSGNGNDWTSSGLASTDVVLDSPTNNFPIILDDKGGTSQVYSEGNLHANIGSNSYAAKSSMFVPMDSGKWYVEALSDATSGSGAGLGTYTPDSMNTLSSISYYFTGNIVLATDMIHYYSSGSIYNAGSSVQSSLTTVGDKDIIGMLIDTDAKTVQFYVNGTASGTAESMANTTDPVAAQLHGHNSRPFMFNFGTDSSFANRKTSGSANATDANGIGDFYYTPPAGAKAICSDNLPEPSISPLHGEQPEDYFNTVLYTGNGSSQAITVGFAPDLVWVKNRSAVANGIINDTIRGAGVSLQTPSTSAELGSAGDLFDSLDSNGFTVNALYSGSVNPSTNKSADTYVSWNWLAGGTGVSNTDGSITSTVSANQTAGFSVVGYTGTGSATTVGHGLSSAPEMVIVKNRSVVDGWLVWHEGLSSGTSYLLLHSTNAQASNSAYFNGLPTSSVFNIGTSTNTNGSGNNLIAYCFHSVAGYSLCSSYTGNGSSDGTFVHCGFRPAWIMFKRTDSTGNWWIIDNKRDITNQMSNILLADDSTAEFNTGTGWPGIDYVSNGFKLRGSAGGINTSGGSYIFLAFAEAPFKLANAR